MVGKEVGLKLKISMLNEQRMRPLLKLLSLIFLVFFFSYHTEIFHLKEYILILFEINSLYLFKKAIYKIDLRLGNSAVNKLLIYSSLFIINDLTIQYRHEKKCYPTIHFNPNTK
jgi:hypothetical protein